MYLLHTQSYGNLHTFNQFLFAQKYRWQHYTDETRVALFEYAQQLLYTCVYKLLTRDYVDISIFIFFEIEFIFDISLAVHFYNFKSVRPKFEFYKADL